MMRLNREAKMAKKDIEAQIKKSGRITDNYLCLPDPDNIREWYYVVWGIEEPKEYLGGYYLGKITCPEDYPQKAPNIKIFTDNGRFNVMGDGICLSISDFHPESWNPAWKVNQILIGLLSFWIGGEYTYGAVEEYHWKNPSYIPNPYRLNCSKERTIRFAMDSRDSVMNHEMFKKIFMPYIDAMGINQEFKNEDWTKLKEKCEQNLAQILKEKQEAEEKARIEQQLREEEERKRLAEEQERKRLEEEKRKARLIPDYFKQLRKKGFHIFIGNPQLALKIKVSL